MYSRHACKMYYIKQTLAMPLCTVALYISTALTKGGNNHCVLWSWSHRSDCCWQKFWSIVPHSKSSWPSRDGVGLSHIGHQSRYKQTNGPKYEVWVIFTVHPLMAKEVPSEPCLQHQIRTVVQYYIPGGHSDRRGRGELCTGRGRNNDAFCFPEDLEWE